MVPKTEMEEWEKTAHFTEDELLLTLRWEWSNECTAFKTDSINKTCDRLWVVFKVKKERDL